MSKISQRNIRAWRVLCPPLNEQHHITASIVRQCDGINLVVDRSEREIALLREYRTRLIADVVTGKLDLREPAGRLPDEGEEAEPPDEIEAEGEGDLAGADDTDEVPEEAEA